MRRLAVLFLLLAPGTAQASAHHFSLRAGPFRVGRFDVRMLRLEVPVPRVKGYVTRLHAELVDARGRRVHIDRAMLHHMYLRNLSRERIRTCNSLPEVFYGTGEENQSLVLPRGYGYRLAPGDRWELSGMLMSHRYRPVTTYVRYTGTVQTRRLAEVRPFWVRANGCRSASYNVRGGGAPGSVDDRVFRWRVPVTGRLVAAGGHLHAGAVGLQLRDPGCGNRLLYDNRPFYAGAGSLLYRARPRLHEPGPVQTSWFSSRTGIPVRRGERLALHGRYAGDHARGAVMAITHVYIAPGPVAGRRCAPLPRDARQSPMRPGLRRRAPYQPIPLWALGAHNRPVEIGAPPGPLAHLRDGGHIDLAAYRFQPERVVVRAGASLTFRFRDRTDHNLTFASGPRAVGGQLGHRGSEQRIRFTRPGRYRLFCYLHPMSMHEQIDVVK